VLPAPSIKAIVADREFIGKQCFTTLDDYGLPYYIRIRQNALVSYRGRTRSARVLFRDLKTGQARRLRKPRLVYGQWVFVATLRLERDYLIVVSNTSAKQALEIYRLRWGIEVLFAALESRGFNFEETHLVDRERIAKLVALLALAFPWAHLVGLWLAEAKPPKMQESWAPGAASVPVGVGSVAVCVAEPDASACGFFRVCVVAHRTANRARHT
ncbi:MAG: transposase, partial [Bacteroidetes bacterium]|nr:transposase [Bacteroidota bacterium]